MIDGSFPDYTVLPKGPDAVLDNTNATSVAGWRAHDKKLDVFYEQEAEDIKNKGKVLLVITGQMAPMMKTQVEGDEQCGATHTANDVVGSLSLIKSNSYTTVSAQCPFWTAVTQLQGLMNCRPKFKETLPAFYKRWRYQQSRFGNLSRSI